MGDQGGDMSEDVDGRSRAVEAAVRVLAREWDGVLVGPVERAIDAALAAAIEVQEMEKKSSRVYGEDGEFPVGAQQAISRWLCDHHCHTDPNGLPRTDPMPPLQTAYEAIRALHDAGYEIVTWEVSS